jgi:hypothetical protein
MAHTIALLGLIDEFPRAFIAPEEAPPAPAKAVTRLQSDNAETQALLDLIPDFQDAFIDPVQSTQNSETTSAIAVSTPVTETSMETMAPGVEPQGAIAFSAPAGYNQALHRTIATMAWGKIEVDLRYGSQGLNSLAFTVGKSGTEVQSLCEAIARLVNLLLSKGVPVSEICRQIRGIRGGDSEGLGPHRFLGLADLIGKVLQEAPAQLQAIAEVPVEEVMAVGVAAPMELGRSKTEAPVAVMAAVQESHGWVSLADESPSASLCPDCGAELHQVNGCSGGACVVCGYSSCS